MDEQIFQSRYNAFKEVVMDSIPTILDGTLEEFIEDTGGEVLCDVISEELAEYLEGEGWNAGVVWLDLRTRTLLHRDIVPHKLLEHYPNLDPDYPPGCTAHHAVVLAYLDGSMFVVDLTAKQFDESLPFPLIVDYPSADENWVV